MNDGNEVKVDRQNCHKGGLRLYASNKEVAAIGKSCGDSGVILYGYYLSKKGRTWDTKSDGATARALGWKTLKVKTNRLKLENAGWVDHTTANSPGYDSSVWFLGEFRVAAFRIKKARLQYNLDDAIGIINKFQVKYDNNPKIYLLLDWLNDGSISLYRFEKKIFDEQPFVLICESTGWIYTKKRASR